MRQKMQTKYVRKPARKRSHGVLGIDRRIILKWNIAIKWTALLHIWKVLGSNLSMETGYPHGVLWVSSVRSG
jgi:hypothetical protein